MVQTFEKFLGLPEDLIIRLDAIKTAGGTIQHVITSHVAATYVIIWAI
jgi:hypothetical protein